MDAIGIGLGVVLLAIVGVVVWIARHPPAHAAPSVSNLTTTIATATADSWAAIKSDLPAIISDEVAQLQADKAALTKRAEAAEAALAAEIKASEVRLAAVKDQVGTVIAGISSQPAATLVSPPFIARDPLAHVVLAESTPSVADSSAPAPQPQV